jgi:hypothetical protein
MYIVSNFPHLRGLEMVVLYHELQVPRTPSMMSPSPSQMKWKESSPHRTRPPGPKHYINGTLIKEAEQPHTPLSRVPPPAERFPRREGITRVFPSDPDFEEICRKQGFFHLIPDYQASSDHKPHTNGITPPSETSINGGSPRLSTTEPQPLPNGTGAHSPVT